MGHAIDEPFGCNVEDLRAGITAATVANSNRTSEDDAVVSPFDYFPWHNKAPEPKPIPEKGTVSDQEYARRMIEALGNG
jgi:hypothetical protein